MAYLAQSFIENKRKDTLYERVKDVLMFPENNKISSPFLSNKQGHKLYQTRELFNFCSLMQFVHWNLTIQERLVQHEPIPSFTSNSSQPLGVCQLLSCPPLAPVMAPISQTLAPAGPDRQVPTLMVDDASVETNLDFGEIISVCESSGFDIKISIAASEKLIDYDFSPKTQSSPSEEAQLRQDLEFEFNFLNKSFFCPFNSILIECLSQ